jgi:hypothetical protein
MFHTILDKCTNFGHDSGALKYHKVCKIVMEKESYIIIIIIIIILGISFMQGIYTYIPDTHLDESENDTKS